MSVLMSDGDSACKCDNRVNTVTDLIVIVSSNTIGTDENTSSNAFIQNSKLLKNNTGSCTRDVKCKIRTFGSWKVRGCKTWNLKWVTSQNYVWK